MKSLLINLPMVNLLLGDRRVRVDQRGKGERTALMEACLLGDRLIVDALLRRNELNVNLIDHNQNTALIYLASGVNPGDQAADQVRAQIAMSLINRRANVRHKNETGFSAYVLAYSSYTNDPKSSLLVRLLNGVSIREEQRANAYQLTHLVNDALTAHAISEGQSISLTEISDIIVDYATEITDASDRPELVERPETMDCSCCTIQ